MKPLAATGEFVRVIDPVTENVLVRLTALSSSCVLPGARNRPVSSRERTLIFSSDRTGHFAPFQADLRTGMVRQIADASQLRPESVSFDRQERAIRYLDGGSLFEAALGHGTPRLLAEDISWYGSAADGALYLISSGRLSRRVGGSQTPLAEGVAAVWPQPVGGGYLFSRVTGSDECELNFAADAAAQPELVAQGRVRQPYWDVDGHSVLFLRDVTGSNGTTLAEIHGRAVPGGSEYLVCPTSQFASFAPNSNATVFVGASRSRAQPNVVLMLRSPCREMTLCEHRASHPAEVSPVFSPDNRRVYFQSDHEGRPAIYSVNVELLVEPE